MSPDAHVHGIGFNLNILQTCHRSSKSQSISSSPQALPLMTPGSDVKPELTGLAPGEAFRAAFCTPGVAWAPNRYSVNVGKFTRQAGRFGGVEVGDSGC